MQMQQITAPQIIGNTTKHPIANENGHQKLLKKSIGSRYSMTNAPTEMAFGQQGIQPINISSNKQTSSLDRSQTSRSKNAIASDRFKIASKMPSSGMNKSYQFLGVSHLRTKSQQSANNSNSLSIKEAKMAKQKAERLDKQNKFAQNLKSVGKEFEARC